MLGQEGSGARPGAGLGDLKPPKEELGLEKLESELTLAFCIFENIHLQSGNNRETAV